VNIAQLEEEDFEFTYSDFTAYLQAVAPDSEKAVFPDILHEPIEMLTSEVEEHSSPHETDTAQTQPTFDEESDTESEHEDSSPNKAKAVSFQEDIRVTGSRVEKRLRNSPKRFTMSMGGDGSHSSEFAASMTPLFIIFTTC
jgi:hypothetical protein